MSQFAALELEFGGTVAKSSGGVKSSSSTAAAGGGGGGESELRKQIIASGAQPVSIDPKKAEDVSQRYIMPSLVVKRSGAHGGAVTLTNFYFLCQCLKRPPQVLLKFLGAEFGCRVVHGKDPRGVEAHDTFTLIGSFEDDRLQAAIFKFNERCVLCHRCRDPVGRLQRAGKFGDDAKDLAKKSGSLLNDLPTATGQAHVSTAPHTVAKSLKSLSVAKLKPMLILDCGGCGHVSFLDPADKLQNLLSFALAQKEEEALKLQKLEEKKKQQQQQRQAAEQLQSEKRHKEENKEEEPNPQQETDNSETDRPPATKRDVPPQPVAPTTSDASPDTANPTKSIVDASVEEKKVKKEKKAKKDKKDKVAAAGEEEAGVGEKEVAVVLPVDAVSMLVSEIKKVSRTSCSASSTPGSGGDSCVAKAVPSESGVKSTVSDIGRLFGVEGGKQAKCQLVLRALVTAEVVARSELPDLLPLLGENDVGDKEMASSSSSFAVARGWLAPWLGSKSLSKAVAAELSATSDGKVPPQPPLNDE